MGRTKEAKNKTFKYIVSYYIPKLDVWVLTDKISSFKELADKLDLSSSTIKKIYKNEHLFLNKFVKIEDFKSKEVI